MAVGSLQQQFLASDRQSQLAYWKTHLLGLSMPMVTVLRSHGLTVEIFKDDHPPAHVHVFGDGFAKIDLVTLNVIRQRGMSLGELRRSRRLVRDHRDALLVQWRLIHG